LAAARRLNALGRQLCRHLAQRQATSAYITDNRFQLGRECLRLALLSLGTEPAVDVAAYLSDLADSGRKSSTIGRRAPRMKEADR
jgi:hypothetical protein